MRTINGDCVVITWLVVFDVDAVPVRPGASVTHTHTATAIDLTVFDGDLEHGPRVWDRYQVKRQMLAHRKRDLNAVLQEVGHNTCQANVAFVLGVMAHV